MTIQIREMRREDVERCGRICHAAFKDISERHNFRPDFPTPESAIGLIDAFFASPNVFKIVAERDGEVIGSNHLWEYDAIRAVGPITIDFAAQAKGVGRMLMEAVIERGKSSAGVRLVQDSFQRNFAFAVHVTWLRRSRAAGIDGRQLGWRCATGRYRETDQRRRLRELC